MFGLHDIRKSKVWQEAFQIGIKEGRERQQKILVKNCLTNGKSVKETAGLVGIPIKEVRRLAKEADE